MTGIRSWTPPTGAFAWVMIMVQDFARPPVSMSFHSSHSPANEIGCSSRRVK
jgi:hypothetical protein